MANPEHLEILKQGVEVWNNWRNKNPDIHPDLKQAHLVSADLTGANLSDTMLLGAHLSDAKLSGANLRNANLNYAILSVALLNFADMSNAILIGADLTSAFLYRANVSNALVGGTVYANTDLSTVVGLDKLQHQGPSTIGIDTLYLSGDSIPESFLLDSGVPEEFITYLPSIIGAQQALQFYSCFISYNHQDEEFARYLHTLMRAAKLRVWYAPEDIKGGEKLHEQIYKAIQVHDRLLLVLSEHSLKSEWVMTEIRRARKIEREENRRKLFPIRLVDFNAIQQWECFDADSGKDLAIEVREYFIPDFSNWLDHDAFKASFDRLLRDLKAEDMDCTP